MDVGTSRSDWKEHGGIPRSNPYGAAFPSQPPNVNGELDLPFAPEGTHESSCHCQGARIDSATPIRGFGVGDWL